MDAMIEADMEDQQDSRIWSGKSLALTQSSSSSMLRHKGAPESSKTGATTSQSLCHPERNEKPAEYKQR